MPGFVIPHVRHFVVAKSREIKRVDNLQTQGFESMNAYPHFGSPSFILSQSTSHDTDNDTCDDCPSDLPVSHVPDSVADANVNDHNVNEPLSSWDFFTGHALADRASSIRDRDLEFSAVESPAIGSSRSWTHMNAHNPPNGDIPDLPSWSTHGLNMPGPGAPVT